MLFWVPQSLSYLIESSRDDGGQNLNHRSLDYNDLIRASLLSFPDEFFRLLIRPPWLFLITINCSWLQLICKNIGSLRIIKIIAVHWHIFISDRGFVQESICIRDTLELERLWNWVCLLGLQLFICIRLTSLLAATPYNSSGGRRIRRNVLVYNLFKHLRFLQCVRISILIIGRLELESISLSAAVWLFRF